MLAENRKTKTQIEQRVGEFQLERFKVFGLRFEVLLIGIANYFGLLHYLGFCGSRQTLNLKL